MKYVEELDVNIYTMIDLPNRYNFVDDPLAFKNFLLGSIFSLSDTEGINYREVFEC